MYLNLNCSDVNLWLKVRVNASLGQSLGPLSICRIGPSGPGSRASQIFRIWSLGNCRVWALSESSIRAIPGHIVGPNGIYY